MNVRKLMYDDDMLALKAKLVSAFNAIHSNNRVSQAKGLYEAYRAIERLPEPTLDNTELANTHHLVRIRDEFFQYEDNPGRNASFRVIWKFFIWIYELDAYYRDRIDWVVEKLYAVYMVWQPRAPFKPRITYWREHDEKMARRLSEKKN
jgi:hypothetical protein